MKDPMKRRISWWLCAQVVALVSPVLGATAELIAPHAMVVASSGAGAADAGLELLKRGGTAMDAAMAVAMAQPCHAMGSFVSYAGVITVVYFDSASGKVYGLDGGFNTVRGEKSPLTIPAPAGDLVALSRTGPASQPSGRTALVPGSSREWKLRINVSGSGHSPRSSRLRFGVPSKALRSRSTTLD